MVNARTNDLNYGHFGQAIYDTENSQWFFGRMPSARREWKQLGTWKTVLRAPTRQNDTSAPHNPRTIRNAQRETRELLRRNPELAPASAILPDSALTSAAVTSILSTYDPAVGNVLSFGHTTDEHRRKSKLIAAVPSGDCGNILRIVLAPKSRHGWEQDKNPWLEIESLEEEESGWFVDDAAPIQQLCFSQSDDRYNFLAVRFPTKTVLFRPIYHLGPHPSCRSAHYELPPSRLSPRPILSLRIADTGGVPHADVTFNLEYQRQFGVIDQKGAWSVWDLDGGHRNRLNYTMSCTNKGTISRVEFRESDSTPRIKEDGWARILWVGNVNTILVCNRRELEVLDIRGEMGQSTVLACPQVVAPRSPDWILDVKRCAKRKNQFYALTSTYLYLLEVRTLAEAEGGNDVEAGVFTSLSWRHYRGAEDTTLKLCVAAGPEDDSVVLIYSRLNSLISVFRFSEGEQEPPLSYSSSDPIELQLDDDILGSDANPKHIANFHLAQVPYGENEVAEPAGLGAKYMSNHVCFYNLTVVLSDFSVHETLICALDPKAYDSNGTGSGRSVVEVPSWQRKVRQGGFRSEKAVDELDDFVVPDGIEALAQPKLIKSSRLQKHASTRKRRSPQSVARDKEAGDPWSVDNSLIYRALVKPTSAESVENGNEQRDILSILDSVRDMLVEDPMPQDNPLGTLFDFAQAQFSVEDIDKASSQLSQLFELHREDADNESSSFELQRIAPAEILRLVGNKAEEPAISSIYDFILQNWIAPLPSTIPGRVRYVKEQLARRIATEIMLASSRISVVEPPQQAEPKISQSTSSQITTQEWSATVPVLSSPRKQSERGSSAIPGSSFPLPLISSSPPPYIPRNTLPTPEPTPSIVSGSTFASSIAAAPFNPTSHLRKHLTINNPPATMPPSVNQVLLHWQIGDDPGMYDWDMMTKAVHEKLNVDDEASLARRAKLQRKAERHLRRQRRETMAMVQKGILREKAESQPIMPTVPNNFMRSSPGPGFGGGSVGGSGFGGGFGGGGSSQGTTQPVVVASQVERGVHGGRPKKKKARMSGF
ncbi:hypothetical protein GQ43DRAFT_279210 [Delitschia confertaspora ATCC 74209]|uniref:RNA polymerase I-specific transcription initiation factor RRN6-like protein n=1 Tax=Delitschia confertaspora ATCC 74209 TaxID=1513339 RepID=A0A9P4MXH2_9PLEO|nr:hypothetical protein GQ43DRAFT_279210 [Delitschia confertaspora ATCC 74209]